MANRYRGAIYAGVTSSIAHRSFQHHDKTGSEYCKRYSITRLVHAKFASTIGEAIAREKAVKKWRRAWKIELIEQANPEWLDLFDTLNGAAEEKRDSRLRGNDGDG